MLLLGLLSITYSLGARSIKLKSPNPSNDFGAGNNGVATFPALTCNDNKSDKNRDWAGGGQRAGTAPGNTMLTDTTTKYSSVHRRNLSDQSKVSESGSFASKAAQAPRGHRHQYSTSAGVLFAGGGNTSRTAFRGFLSKRLSVLRVWMDGPGDRPLSKQASSVK